MLCALAGALLFAACGDGDDDGGGNGDGSTPTGGAITCGIGTGDSMAKYQEPPAMTIDANKKYFATIKMDIGDIKLELYPKEAPCHVNSFVFLSREGFYDGVTFHRVLPGFVAQGGDPLGTGGGGPGYTVPLEVSTTRKHIDGALGMARTQDPNSAGSQFFIDYGPQPALDPGANGPGYTVFGQVVEGRDVLDKITPRDPQNPADRTVQGTKINTIEIAEE
jgi:cyclophilin family peptidyl-prolyl cis-trans isomerase